jgi:hypothetical protein
MKVSNCKLSPSRLANSGTLEACELRHARGTYKTKLEPHQIAARLELCLKLVVELNVSYFIILGINTVSIT